MAAKRIEKVKAIAKKAGLDLKISRQEQATKETIEFLIQNLDLDTRIDALEREVSDKQTADSEYIESEIEIVSELLGHTVEIDHRPKASRALEVYKQLSDEQKHVLLPLIEGISQFRKRIEIQAAKLNAPQICKKCDGGCCGRGPERMISEMDFFYMLCILSDEQREKVWEVINLPDKISSKCRFKGKNGCVIPSTATPNFCKSYYCEDVPIIGEYTVTAKYEAWLKSKVIKLQKRLLEMGFELKL